MITIQVEEDLFRALGIGPRVCGYPTAFHTTDGDLFSYKTVHQAYEEQGWEGMRSDLWCIGSFIVHTGANDLVCDHSGEKIG